MWAVWGESANAFGGGWECDAIATAKRDTRAFELPGSGPYERRRKEGWQSQGDNQWPLCRISEARHPERSAAERKGDEEEE